MSTSRLLGAVCVHIFTLINSRSQLIFDGCAGITKHLNKRFWRESFLSFFTLTALLSGNTASAYYIQVAAQALAHGDPNEVIYSDLMINGPTSITYDTGLVYGSDPLYGYAQNSVSADLATGTLRFFANSSYTQVAGGSVTLYDILTFALPDGMASTTVTASFTIDGSVSAYLNPGTLPQDLYFQCLYATPTCSSGSGHDTVSLHDFTSPTTLTVSATISNGASLQIQASLSGSIAQGSYPMDSVIDLSNTGRLSMNLEPGVTFSSESGVFLTAVPIPAAIFTFISGLLGLIGMSRRKKLT